MSKAPGAPRAGPAVVATILASKCHMAPSAFTPENLPREARRQKALAEAPVPDICMLDPDGNMVHLICAAAGAWRRAGRQSRDA